MPKVKFVRTPTEAEAGPGGEFKIGEVYEVGMKSWRRWIEIGCAVDWKDEVPVEPEKVNVVESGGQAPPIIVPRRSGALPTGQVKGDGILGTAAPVEE